MKKRLLGLICIIAFVYGEPVILQTKDEPITVFVHGTLPPGTKSLIHFLDIPLGISAARCVLTCYCEEYKRCSRFHQRVHRGLIMNRLGYLLDGANPAIFPIDNFYFYGWEGCLSFKVREQAAEDLYLRIRDYKNITLIGHSHGANVVLELVGVAEAYGDTNFRVKKVILMGCPVQEATKHYARSPIFERVYSLYSLGDTTQVADPQRLYMRTRQRVPYWRDIPFWSERLFPLSDNLVQARILMNRGNPSHLGFILPTFVRRLPDVIELLDTLEGGQTVIVDTPPCDKPYLVISVCKKHSHKFAPIKDER